MSEEGLVSTFIADSYLAELNTLAYDEGQNTSWEGIKNTNREIASKEANKNINRESIFMDNVLPTFLALVAVFLFLLTLLSTSVLSSIYKEESMSNRAKFAGFLAIFASSLIAFNFGIYRYFRKSGTAPDVSAVWIYGVVLLITIIVLFTTTIFKNTYNISTTTQTSSVSSDVTINGNKGVITTLNQTASPGGETVFTVNNSSVKLDSVILTTLEYPTLNTGFPIMHIADVANGSFKVVIRNSHPTESLNSPVKIHFDIYGKNQVVVQGTSPLTDVAINGGVITTFNQTASPGNETFFTVNNSSISGYLSQTILSTLEYPVLKTGFPVMHVADIDFGSFKIVNRNVHSTESLNGPIKVHFKTLSGVKVVNQTVGLISAIVINSTRGSIATFAQTTAPGGEVVFNIINPAVKVNSLIIGQIGYDLADTGYPVMHISDISEGSFKFVVRNMHTTESLNGRLYLYFEVF